MINQGILTSLVENQVAESRDLEFKQVLPGRSDEQVKEFLKDVTALANAQGGDLIFGVQDENGVATSLPGVTLADPDAEILRLESSLQTGVAPRLVGVRTHWIPLAESGVIFMRVPASINAPHRIIFKNSGRFWSRNSRGNYEMDVHELRHAFTQSEQLPQRFRQLHVDAIAAAQGVDMPFAVEQSPTAVISVAPLALFREAQSIHITRNEAVAPVRATGYSAIDLIEGVLLHAAIDAKTGTVSSYALTHRTGRTDAAWVIGGIRTRDNGEEIRVVWPGIFERGLCEMATSTQSRLHPFGIEGPWVILITVFGVKGYCLYQPAVIMTHAPTCAARWS